MKYLPLAASAWFLLGCGGAESDKQDASEDASAMNAGSSASDGFAFHADAGPEGPLVLGRCVLQDGGDDCTGQPDEAQKFVALDDGDPMRIVFGPQGSFMLVVLLRAEGIDGGDVDAPASADNPSVEIQLREESDDSIVTRFRGRVAFRALSGGSGELESNDALFIVVDGQEEALVGQSVILEAVLQDRSGERRRGLMHVLVAK